MLQNNLHLLQYPSFSSYFFQFHQFPHLPSNKMTKLPYPSPISRPNPRKQPFPPFSLRYPIMETQFQTPPILNLQVPEITFVRIIAMISTRTNSEDYDLFSTKDRSSATSSHTNDSDLPQHPNKNCLLPLRHDLRPQLFENQLEVCELSAKLTQRAVTWMITLCWSKSLHQECLWATLLLFYCYKQQKRIRKDDIELTLLSCLFLATKLTHSSTHTAKEIAVMSSKPLSPSEIVEKEASILEIVHYNAIIPHYLSELYLYSGLSPDKLEEVMLVCELFATKDFHIFFNRQKVEAIVQLLGSEDAASEEGGLRLEVRDLVGQKENKMVLHKYASKFNINLFVQRFA